MPHHLLKKTHK